MIAANQSLQVYIMVYASMNNNDLALIVRVNEDIKKIVRLASKINILALNAILVSRRAGDVALGFGVISDELRKFSKELTDIMNNLTVLSYESVQVVSQHQRYLRINHLLTLARDNSDAQFIEAQLFNSNKHALVLKNNLRQGYQLLSKLINDADDSSRFGSVISRSLKIEATYGGQFSILLSQIADEFSDYIDAIHPLINELKFYFREK
ncbi:hypothetical protein [Cellvibrio sp. KY-GH-1]|uniref:hypothetical protein n=1 Tax=Cellvibrio sp. KY-GH-1 TaxID=2303332 RepID=UPI00124834D8|nr:hypothetical protein [Cellvibrio sp. KY-GH-1]